MDGSLRREGISHFLLIMLLMFSSFSAPVSGALKSGTWQEVNTSTDAINGTVPLADGVTIPVYQGSIQLKSDETNTINFSAMPPIRLARCSSLILWIPKAIFLRYRPFVGKRKRRTLP